MLTDDYSLSDMSVMLTMAAPTDSITITAVADDIDEGSAEDIMLSYSVNPTSVDAPGSTTLTITDNDTRGINPSTAPALTIGEGGSEDYTLVLTSEPMDTVTIALSLAGSDIGALSFTAPPTITATTSLEFTTGNWDTAQTVTVYADEDDDSVDETATISFIITGGDYGNSAVTLGDQAVNVTDNDDATVTAVANAMVMSETSGMVTITFTLAHPPAGDVTVTVDTPTGSATLNTDYRLSPTQVTLNAGNLEDSIIVTATPDSVNDDNETITLSYSLSGSGATGISTPGATNLTITEGPSVTVVPSGNSMTEEGGTNTVTLDFTLNNFVGSGNVTVTVGTPTGSAMLTDDYTLSAMSVTLTMAAPTGSITVTAEADGIDEGSAEDIMLSYTVNPTSVDAPGSTTLTITDNDSRGINPSTAPALTIGEGGSEDYTLVLTSEPTDTVTIALSLAGSDIGALSFTAPPTITATTSLEFTTGNWSSAQTVTVYADEDDDSVDETATISFIITGGDYGNSAVTLGDQAVNVTDNDDATVTAVANAMVMSETSGMVTITFTLAHPPAGDVIVTVNTPTGSATLNTDYRLSPTQVTLNAGNLEDSIIVTATPDSVNDNNETITLSYRLSGSGASGITAPPATNLTITEGPSVTVVPSRTSMDEEGGTNSVTLDFTLNNFVGAGNVTVTVGTPTGSAMLTDDYILSAMSVTLTMAAPTGSITVTAEADGIDEGSAEDIMLSYTVNPTSVDAPSDTTLTITDNDSRGITLTPAGAITVTEEAAIPASLTVVLTSEPTENVTVRLQLISVNSSDISGLGLTTATVTTATDDLSLTFNADSTMPGPWNTAQTVTVAMAADDGDSIDETAAIMYTITGGDYGAVATAVTLANQAVNVTDDDTATVTAVAGSSTVSEASGTVIVTFTLAHPPAGDVIVTVDTPTGSAVLDTDYSLSAMRVTLNAGNLMDTITVTATPDSVNDNNETIMLSYSVSGGITAPGATNLTITEGPSVTVVPSGSSMDEEGGTNTVTLDFTLNNFVGAGNVTVTVGTPTGSAMLTDDYSLSAMSVMLTMAAPTDSITVTAVADDIDEGGGEDIMLSYTVNPTSVAAPGDTTVTITDNDSRGITLNPTGAITVTEEAATPASLTVVLTSEPTENVTVRLQLISVNSSDISGLGLTTATVTTATDDLSLTFNADSTMPGPWNTAQTVTVAMAADDGDSIDETAAIMYTITGGDYGAVATAVTLANQAVNVTDNDTATVTAVADVMVMSETSGMVTITFTLTNPPAEAVTVTVDTPTGSAVLDTDYSLSSMSVELDNSNPPTSLTGSITVTATPDSVNDNNETIMLSYSVSGGITAPGATNLTITEGPSVTVVPSGSSMDEEGGTNSVTLDFTLNNFVGSGNVTVTVGTPTGSAMLTDDYILSAMSVMLTMAAPTDSITITAVADDIDEGGGEDIMLSYTVNPTSVAAPGDTTVTITDNDTRGITLNPTGAITVTEEAATPASLTVVLTSEPTENVTVRLQLISVNSSDISGLGLTTATVTTATDDLSLTFNADSTMPGPWNTAQTVTVAMAADDGDSIDETAAIMYTITGGDYGAVETAVTLGNQAVNVTDDDTATVTAVPDAMVMSETSGMVTITFTLTNPPAEAVTVTVDTPTGSAVLDTDYSLSAMQLSLDNSNPPTSLTGTITVTATPDSVNDDNETIMLSYSVSGGIMAPSATNLTITEEPTVMVAVSPVGNSVAEGTGSGNGGEITLTFSLSSEPLVMTNNVIVDVNAPGGDAILNTDYMLDVMSVTLESSNSFEAVITVSVEPDTIVEPDETIDLSYDVSRSTAANVTGPDSGNTLTITNDDSSDLTVEVAVTPGTPVTTLNEGDTGTVILKLSNPVHTAVTVMVATNNDGTASAAEPASGIMADFTAISSQAVTIPAGMMSSDPVPGDLVILADTVVEADSEILNITITEPDPAIPGVTVTASTAITITDTDTTELSIADQAVTEDTSDGDNITITLSAPRSEDLEVTVNTGAVGGGMDATAGTDYTALSSHRVTIPAYATSHEFAVMVADDNDAEGNEVFQLTISESADRVTLGTATATITITDDDVANLSIADIMVNEGAGSAELTLSLSSTLPSDDVVVAVTTGTDSDNETPDATPGSTSPLSAGEDYLQQTNTMVTIAMGTMSNTVQIAIAGDNLVEADEVFTVTISVATEPDGFDIARDMAVVTIVDDDEATLSLSSHALGSRDISEATASTTLTLSLAATGGGTVTLPSDLNITIMVGGDSTATAGDVGGTPGAGQDYTLSDLTPTIATASTSADVTLTINTDTVDEDDETIILSFSTDNEGVAVPETPITLTITDDDVPEASISPVTSPVSEAGTVTDACDGTPTRCANITVNLDREARPMGVAVTITSGSPGGTNAADFTADYTVTGTGVTATATSVTVTVPGGETEAVFTVTAVDDDDIEADGTVTFTLQDGGDDYSLTSNLQERSSAVTISSEDLSEASISISTGDGSPAAAADISEEGGIATVTVTFTPALMLTENIRVNFRLDSIGRADTDRTNRDIDFDFNAIWSSDDIGAGPEPRPQRISVRGVRPTTTYVFTISGRSDDDADPGEGYTLTLQNLANVYNAAAAPDNSITINIIDDDVPEASIDDATATISEGAMAVPGIDACAVGTLCRSYTVSLDIAAPPMGVSVMVNITPSGDSTATVLNTDYTVSPVASDGTEGTAALATPFTVPVAGGSDEASFVVTVANDNAVEADGIITFSLATGEGYTVAADSGDIAVTIDSDDLPAASIALCHQLLTAAEPAP